MKNSKSDQKFKKVMHEFGQGTLKSGSGEKVTDQKQALAIAFNEARDIDLEYGMKNGGGISGEKAAELAKIYKSGTAKELWEAWPEPERMHFLADHLHMFMELLGNNFKTDASAFTLLTFDTLPAPIRKEVIIHHAMGMYKQGSDISSKLSPAKQKLQSRINTLKATKANAGAAAQKAIQKKIDVLQAQLDYNPSAKERAMANKGKFALDVPAAYSKAIYKKLWSMNIRPSIHKLNGTASIVVNSQINLNKAYQIYSDLAKEKGDKVLSQAKISRKL